MHANCKEKYVSVNSLYPYFPGRLYAYHYACYLYPIVIETMEVWQCVREVKALERSHFSKD